MVMGELMREACQALGGKGGGTPDFAQGGGTDVSQLELVLNSLREKIHA
jgi:alanyl-tRNA synthetase